jgi:hypothetical protein
MESLLSLLSSLAPSHLALFGAIFAGLVLVTGMILSRNDIRVQVRGSTPQRRILPVSALTSQSSPEFLFLQEVTRLLDEIMSCQATGAIVAATAMTYLAIDGMAFLAMPRDQSAIRREDFVRWVDQYFRAASSQEGILPGDAVYQARCLLLDGFIKSPTSETDGRHTWVFNYVETGVHRFGPDNLTVISVASLIDDLSTALDRFASAWHGDEELRARAAPRLAMFDSTFPFWRGSRLS